MNKNKIYSILTEEIPEKQIYIDEPMNKHTSFKIGGNADIYVKVKEINELLHVINTSKNNNLDLTVIGNGSNVLVKDNGIRGIVLNIDFDKVEIKDNIVTVGAGVKLGALAHRLLKEELQGFEFASGIPGTIGGAIRMNAGAYGKEMKDIVIETICVDLENKDNPIITLKNSEQNFSYRHSIFMEKKYLIIQAKLKLQKGSPKNIKELMDEYLKSRKEKQPLSFPNAGSIFKSGNDFITAKLIDECGLKGYNIGDAQVSNLHAGFIVNKGNATAKDVIDLIKYIKEEVLKQTGKSINLEIEIIGE